MSIKPGRACDDRQRCLLATCPLVQAPAIGALFGLVVHTRKLIADQRVALADYKTRVAERYVPFSVQDAFEKEAMRRLERTEDKLDTQAEHFATALAVNGLD